MPKDLRPGETLRDVTIHGTHYLEYKHENWNCPTLNKRCLGWTPEIAAEFPLESCHSGSDGDCNWERCPQLRDNEPRANGRCCPLIVDWEED